ncbi:MAG: DUF1254 domain-containing protein [Acidimicrobiales bacterium]
MTPSRAKAVAQIAYLFTFPLVMNYREMYRQAVDASSSSFSGGFGTWRQVAPTESGSGGVAGPSGGALQSMVWLDLRTEPWWYTEPAVPPGVSFRSRWIDLWGFELDDRGAPKDGRHRASVLAASPTRVRSVPVEVDAVVRGESAFVALRTEVRWRDESAGREVPRVLADMVLEPVSAHLGRPAPAPAPAMSWWRWRDGMEVTDEFWSCASFALSLTTPHPDDRSILDRIAEIGVVSGQPWDASRFPDEIAESIGTGMDGGLSDLLEATSETVDACGEPCRREEMDRDCFGRALGALYPVDALGGLRWPTDMTEALQ